MSKEIKRILEISYKYGLSHIGSCLTAVGIIDDIFQKKETSKFVLSSGHAGLALYVILEKNGGKNAENIFLHHGVHPDRCADCGIDCSSGSLGNGLPIALGMALADKTKPVYCLISDGECSEGSVWEVIRLIHDLGVNNLRIYVNWNGWAAYSKSSGWVKVRLSFEPNISVIETKQSLFTNQDAHYHVLTKEEYEKAIC